MQQTQTFMSGKLSEAHQSNVMDWIMQNLDPPEPFLLNPKMSYSIQMLAKKTSLIISRPENYKWLFPSTRSQICHCRIWISQQDAGTSSIASIYWCE